MEEKRKICIVTGTRADWGLLSGIARALAVRPDVRLQIVATNMHLSAKYGMTVNEILDDGFQVDRKVEMAADDDSPQATVKAMSRCMTGMSAAFTDLRPDLLLILGDRYEMLCVASVALMFRIPVAHIAGGAVSLGAYDESIRHAITKMSHIHLTETEEYRCRVIQLGENPAHVYNTGAIGVYNILHTDYMSRSRLEADLHTTLPERSMLVTLHPATLDSVSPGEQCAALLRALDRYPDWKVIFTYPNNDTDGQVIIRMIDDYVRRYPGRCAVFASLGRRRYLSALRCVAAVVGNSSSGIVEVPSMGIPTLDIGLRQAGRTAAVSVTHCGSTYDEIAAGLAKVLSDDERQRARTVVNPYARPDTLERIVEAVCETPLEGLIVKPFYDLNQTDK